MFESVKHTSLLLNSVIHNKEFYKTGTYSKVRPSRRHDTWHNDIQHNDTQYSRLICDVMHK